MAMLSRVNWPYLIPFGVLAAVFVAVVRLIDGRTKSLRRSPEVELHQGSLIAAGPSRRRRQFISLALIVGLTPGAVGLLFMPTLPWQLRAVPQSWSALVAGIMFGSVAIGLILRSSFRSTFRRNGGFLGRHLWFSTPVTGVLAAAGLTIGTQGMLDLVVPPDTIDVVVTATLSTGRGLQEEVLTSGSRSRSYKTPLLWYPPVAVGPARLTVGHFSGLVLRIEQDPETE